jgi:pimeloyl-ACP methyl ester carboxylesterase
VPLTRWYLNRASPEALSGRLTGTTRHAPALGSSVTDLRRGTVAATAARLLAATTSAKWRQDLRAKLRHYPGRVHIVVGSGDLLGPEGEHLLGALPQATLTVIPDAGHHPQLTHPQEVAQAIREHTSLPPRAG